MDKHWIHFHEENKKGRDFVVGDIHGCFDSLIALLAKINFNPKQDRLFSVGDLIDRGKKSRDCLDLLKKPWFFAVRGNHEQLLLDFWAGDQDSPFDSVWLDGATEDLINEWKKIIQKLPYVLKVGTDLNDSFFLMHAELWEHGKLLTSEDIEACSFENEDQAKSKCLWSRHVIGAHWRNSINKFHAPNLPKIFCGHTIVQIPIMVENAIYLDTGAFAPYIDENNTQAEHFGLTIIQADTLQYWFAPSTEKFRGKVIEMNPLSAEVASPPLFVHQANINNDSNVGLEDEFQQVHGVEHLEHTKFAK